MSRTDKTAPAWVKVHYYPSWLKESHDHRHGPCDLPARPDPRNEWVWSSGPGRRCSWVASSEFWNAKLARCCCPMCRPDYGWYNDPRNRKSQRRQGKRLARDWEKEY